MGDLCLQSLSQWVMPGLRVLTQKSGIATGEKMQQKPMVRVTTSLTAITPCPLTQWDIMGPISGVMSQKKKKN